MNIPRTISSNAFALGAAILVGLLPAIFGLQGSSLAGYLGFVVGLVVFLFLPGMFLTRLFNLRIRGLELTCLSFTLGLAASNIAYMVAAIFHAIPLYLTWPVLAVSGLIFLKFKSGLPNFPGRVAIAPYLLVLFVVVLTIFPLLFMPYSARDFMVQPDGRMHLATWPDGVLHMSVTNELTYAFPPQFPFLAGKPLTYHYGMDLVGAMFSRFTKAGTPDICLRFLPVFYLALCVLAVFCFSRRWTASLLAGVLVAFLVILGEDFSFIPGLILHSEKVWTAHFFQIPTVFSLYFLNPMLPASAFLFAGLFCFLQYSRKKRKVWLALSGLHFGVMGTIKVFAACHVLGCLLLASILLVKRNEIDLFRLFLITLVFSVVLMGTMIIYQWGSSAIEVKPDLFTAYLPLALKRMNLDSLLGFNLVTQMYESRTLSASGVGATLLLALPVFILGNFGIRLIGIPSIIKAIVFCKKIPPMNVFLALFVVCGCALTLVTSIKPIDVPDSYDNSVWFFAQSKYIAWLFAGATLQRLWRRLPRWGGFAVTFLVVLLAVPSSIQFFIKMSPGKELQQAGPEVTEIVDYFHQHVPRGSVVLCDDAMVTTSLLSMTGTRVPFMPICHTSFLRMEELMERMLDCQRFWKDWEKGRLRKNLIKKYRVDYVITRIPSTSTEICFENDTYRVYKMNREERDVP